MDDFYSSVNIDDIGARKSSLSRCTSDEEVIIFLGDSITAGFEVNDNEAYKDIWKGEMPLRASDEKIYEYACHEGNYAMANILAGARAEEEN